MKILIACEESQEVCKAFRRMGHNAYSNDLKPCSGGHPEWHLQMDAQEALTYKRWDMLIAHPTCTRLCNSGVLRLYRNGKKSGGIDPVKWEEMEQAARFFKSFLSADIPMKCIENPVPHGYAMQRIGVKYSQIIQPWQFGEDASKATCLWLKGLPLLMPTGYFAPRTVNGLNRWSNQTDGGQNKLPPSENRAELRSKTYPGIAKAMAEQWGGLNRRIIHQQPTQLQLFAT